jgi:DNA-binding helix-hairpin-helix protein with protein kinase domain
LLEAENELLACSANRQHFFHRGLPECPWCAMAKRTGRDPFPELVTDVEIVSEGPALARRSSVLAVASVATDTLAWKPTEPVQLVPWLREPERPAHATPPRWLWWAVCLLLVVLLGALGVVIFLYSTWSAEEKLPVSQLQVVRRSQLTTENQASARFQLAWAEGGCIIGLTGQFQNK